MVEVVLAAMIAEAATPVAVVTIIVAEVEEMMAARGAEATAVAPVAVIKKNCGGFASAVLLVTAGPTWQSP
jgi:hypothetical protein